MTNDVVVIGSGGAGFAAALSAAVRGAKVTVLESAPTFGGTSAISGGGVWLPRIEGSPIEPREAPLTHLRHLTLGHVADSVLERYVDEAPNVAAFFAREAQIRFIPEPGWPDYHSNFPGGAEGRTTHPTLFDTAALGEWNAKLRRPGAGGEFPPTTSDETKALHNDPAGFARLIRERNDKGIVGRGTALIGGLMAACLRHGVQLVESARAAGLVISDGRVTGVIADRGGRTERFDAKQGVVLAAGGFEWNRRMWDELIGVPYDGSTSPPYNIGDGLRLAMSAGARLARLNEVWWTPTRYLGKTYDGQPWMLLDSGSQASQITVNRRGRRFVNESMNYNDVGKLMVAFDPHTYEFPNHPAFMITDAKRRDALRHAAEGSDGDPIFEAGTLRGLAEKAGIDPDGLEDEVRTFNGYAAKGVDPDFHRGESGWELFLQRGPAGSGGGPKNRALVPIDQAPFYAYRSRAGFFGTKGGPVIDANGQVLGLDERPVAGLYAAGNVTAGVFGPAYPGSGATLGPAVTFGYVAGLSVTPG